MIGERDIVGAYYFGCQTSCKRKLRIGKSDWLKGMVAFT